MRLLLIRHAQTIDNARGALGTTLPGPPLTELGLKQAAAIPSALAGEQIEAIYTSRMLRTRLTAQPLARSLGLAVTEVDGLHEISAGELEQRSGVDAIDAYLGAIFSWRTDFRARIPGGEDGAEFFGRFDAALATIAAKHTGTVAVVSHGAAIRAWAAHATRNLDSEFAQSHSLDNTAVVVVEGSPADGWVTTKWGGVPVGGAQFADPTGPGPTGETQ